jgi:lysophospholipase L1-like esterase
VESYTEMQRVRLDPSHEKFFGPANAQLTAPAEGQKRVVLFGDSRIGMWDPPLDLPGFQVINRGVGGETTEQILNRLDRDVIAIRPDVVVIEMGINDLKTIGVFPDRRQEIINSCQRNADLIVERLRRQKIEVILLTIFPPGPVPLTRRMLWSDQTRTAVAEFNRRALGQRLSGLTVLDCDPALADGSRLRSEYVLDTLHLNGAGYAALNRVVGPAVAGLWGDSAAKQK